MSILSEDLCLEATKNSEFSTEWLKVKESLDYEDFLFLADYINRTALIRLDLRLELTLENSRGLAALSNAVANQRHLQEFKFEITRNEAHLTNNDNLFLSIINYFSNRTVKKQNSIVYDAIERMIRNKPYLNKLAINLQEIDSPAHKAQSRRLSCTIRNAPLTHLALNIKTERDASLPILRTNSLNDTLVEVQLFGLTHGHNILNYLQHAGSLRVLIINDMHLTPKDFVALKTILEVNKTLQLVQFSSTNIGQIDSQIFLNALLLCPSITYLNLVENNLNRANIRVLCDYLSHNPERLVELNLTGNAYMKDDMDKLALALTFNTKIKKLILDYNYIEDEGLQTLFHLLEVNPSITSISISHNCRYTPSNQTIAKLCDLLKSKACTIEELYFVQTTTVEQLKMLTDAIMLNTSLVEVTLNFNSNIILESIYKQQIIDHLNGNTTSITPAYSHKPVLESPERLSEESKKISAVRGIDSFFTDDESDSDNSLNNNGLFISLQRSLSSRHSFG